MPANSVITDLAIRYGFQALGALVILIAGAIVARWVGSLVARRLARSTMEPPMRVLTVRVVYILVMLVAVLAALDKFGFQIAPLVAGIGVAGLGLGIALQGVLSNYVAGLTIIFTKPFRVGEYIQVVGVEGEVVSIDLPTTVLMPADRSRVVIPNRKIVGEILHNFGLIRQLKLAVTVAEAAELTTALATVQDVLARNPRVLREPAPVVGVSAVGDTGIRVAIGPWVRGADTGPAEAELYQALVEAFRAREIDLGLARRAVRVVNGALVA